MAMKQGQFDLIVAHQDLLDVLGFGEELVLASKCPRASLAALLIEAAEVAVLDLKGHWPFTQDKELMVYNLRVMAKAKAFEVYVSVGGDHGNS
jgi:hypothetical protein